MKSGQQNENIQIGSNLIIQGSNAIENHVLEFIKKCSTPEVAGPGRNKVEKRLIHLLKIPVLLSFNLGN